MEFIWLALVTILIGALIGGFTNFIAISMLFRPFQRKYLGGWALPFTPGVIPKRHQEIARQLGELVEEHLMTAEMIQKKINSSSFKKELNKALSQEGLRWLSSRQTLNDVFSTIDLSRSRKAQGQVAGEWLEDLVRKRLLTQLEGGWKVFEEKTLLDLLNTDELALEEKIATLVNYSLDKVQKYLYSPAGEDFLYRSLQQILEKQGSLMNMLGMFISKEKIIDKIRPPLLVALEQPTTKRELEYQLQLMIEDVFQKKMHQLIPANLKEQAVESLINWALKQLAISERFDQPLAELLAFWKQAILEYIPTLTNLLIEWLSLQINVLLSRLEIATLVREQVLSFPLPRLERMVKGLATKELKMITWLGAGLGGLIGLIQAVFVYFLL